MEMIKIPDEEEEPTLETLTQYPKLKEITEDFLVEACYKYDKAHDEVYLKDWKHGTSRPSYDWLTFEIREKDIYISLDSRYGDSSSYYLSLGFLFNGDFYEKMKEKFEGEKKVEDDKKRERELKLLEELRKKYE